MWRRFLTKGVTIFFQAEDGIRDRNVTGVQTCALPILNPDRFSSVVSHLPGFGGLEKVRNNRREAIWVHPQFVQIYQPPPPLVPIPPKAAALVQIGRASCRESGHISSVPVCIKEIAIRF